MTTGQPPAHLLFVLVEPGALKVGTCAHCVLEEPGRPARAWDAEGDSALDFERETLLEKLAAFGVVITSKEEYVCP